MFHSDIFEDRGFSRADSNSPGALKQTRPDHWNKPSFLHDFCLEKKCFWIYVFMNNQKPTMLFQFLVVPFSCLLHLCCTHTQHLQDQLYLGMKGSLNLRITDQPSRHERANQSLQVLPWAAHDQVHLQQGWGSGSCRGSSTTWEGQFPQPSTSGGQGKAKDNPAPAFVCLCKCLSRLKVWKVGDNPRWSLFFSPLHLLSQVRRQWMWSNSSQLLLLQGIWVYKLE